MYVDLRVSRSWESFVGPLVIPGRLRTTLQGIASPDVDECTEAAVGVTSYCIPLMELT